jgi:carboxypeptidase Taq
MSESLSKLKTRLAEVNALNSAVAMMDWDQQTHMPKGGAKARAEHTGVLSRLSHELFVADETQTWLDSAIKEVDPTTEDGNMLRVLRRDMDLRTKFPAELVEEKTRLTSQGHEEWVEARAANDFAKFAPFLEKIVDIHRREAELLGYTDHIYDALTDQYEEGASKKFWDNMFDGIREPLTQLVAEIKGAPQVDDSFLYGEWPVEAQRAFSLKLIDAIGFDMERGRLDTAPHPFCTGWSIGDIRLTTRFKNYLPSAIMGSLHEAGHGVYEQGSPMDWDGSPLAGGVSLGFHESQSRTWENIVGRSRAFWSRFLPDLQATFPALQGVDLETWYRALNRSEPSLIRVEADEVTYNLHIMVRFELECDMLTGALAIKDLPEAWNAKYQQYLGITPPNDAEGCLQDVHWSMGSMGYFPTYSMGNILSYQIWNRLVADLGDVESLMAHGDFAPILGWLRENLYRFGRSVRPQDLIKQVTGGGMDPNPYLTAISAKYRAIYGL